MGERALSAPGKLFLSGEYAVLWGGLARLIAVGPRAFALARTREDREVHLVLEAGRLSGHLTPLGVHWKTPVEERFRFAARAVDDAVRAWGKESLGFSVALSPSWVAPSGEKVGMGSSARATVLAVEAAKAMCGADLDSLQVALRSHAETQGGKGSGADVAAIFAGGMVRYRPAQPGPFELRRIAEPSLPLTYAFTGKGASTPSLISHVEARREPASREAFTRASDEAGDALERALLKGAFTSAKEAFAELEALLRGLGPLETEPLRRLLALAESLGSAGKISGAGGGDGVILASPDPEARDFLVKGLEARGILALPLEPEPGVRVEAMADPLLAGWLRAPG